MRGRNPSVVEAWLHQVKDVAHENAQALRVLRTRKGKLERLAELNVMRQVQNVTRTPIVQAAWKRHRDLTVSGWIYHVEDGLLRDLGVTIRA
jgi:carbonic anhydrase